MAAYSFLRTPLLRAFRMWKFLRAYRGKYRKVLLHYARRYRSGDADKGHIIINLSTILPLIGVLFESTMAVALKLRGYKALVLMDDGFTCHNETKAKPYIHSYAEVSYMNRVMRRLSRSLPFVVCYSELFGKAEKQGFIAQARDMIARDDFSYEDIDLRPYIHSSLVKYYASVGNEVSIASSDPSMVLRYTCNAVISVMVAKLSLDRYDPVAYVSSHGIYSTWGPFYHYLKVRDRRPVIYDFGFFKSNGFLFSREGLTAEGNDDSYFRLHEKEIDLATARAYADQVMAERGAGKGADVARMIGKHHHDELPDGFMEKTEGKQVFGLFPNVLWDASITEQRSIFGDAYTWIERMVTCFRESDDKVLVIRVHPSERPGDKTLFGVADLVDKVMGGKGWKSDSVMLIPSGSPLRSYLLFPYLHGGLVFNGTIGLEMAYHRIPVYTAGIAPYSQTPFIRAFGDQDEYISALDHPDMVLEHQEENRDSLLRFIYMYFDLREIPLRFNHPDYYPRLHEPQILDEVLSDPRLDYICRAIVDKELFFTGWHSTDD